MQGLTVLATLVDEIAMKLTDGCKYAQKPLSHNASRCDKN